MIFTILGLLAFQYINVPYRWAGNDFDGLDCSGLVVKVLNEYGYKVSDRTANGLYNWAKEHGFEESGPCEDCLLFYGKRGRITHVDIALSDNLVIGAIGGGKTTISVKEAVRRDARVKIKDIGYRSDLMHSVRITKI